MPNSFAFNGKGNQSGIPNDIFPLISGRRFEYSGYLTTQDTESPIAGSSEFYYTSWTNGGVTPLSAVYGSSLAAIITAKSNGRTNATLIFDSTLFSLGGTKRLTPVFMYYDTSSGDYYYLINLGLFFRGAISKDSANAAGVRKDSLRFIKLASPNAGLGVEFISFEESFVSYANPSNPTTLTIKFTGEWWNEIQNIMVNGVTYTTYYLVFGRTVLVGSTTVATGVTAKLWFAQGIGPVKMFLAGDAEVPGNYRELKSINFTTSIFERPSMDGIPDKFQLLQNYPNPFNPSTTISFSIPSKSYVSLKVFDLTGREQSTIVSEEISAGTHSRQWNAEGLPSGVYFYRLQVGSFTQTRKLVMLK